MHKLLALLLSTTLVQAHWRWGKRQAMNQHMLFTPTVEAPSTIKTATFEQILDHSDPSKGTFSQEYYYDSQYWKGPGSPVIMFAPQEVNASDYAGVLSQATIVGPIAQKLGAAMVLMEHRYWGNSSPYTEQTTENMQYLTLEQAIADCNYFASNVQFPFTKSNVSAQNVPWVLIGGSYSGALTAWIEAKAPGTFWAYVASSAVVEAISDFYGYFSQVESGMAKNCSKDVSLVINHMDNILESGNAKQIKALKTKFGLQGVKHNDDFMGALENGPWLWQNGDWFQSNAPFLEWCDYIEDSVNKTGSAVAGANGVGLEKALAGYATWFKTVFLPGYCANTYGYWTEQDSVACFNTYNAKSPIFTDITVGNTAFRQWQWFLCNEPFGWWQVAEPKGVPSLVSRLITPQYFIRQCALYFPKGPQGQTYGIAKGATEAQVNQYTGGWFIDNTTRLIYTNGQWDPWRDATVSSLQRPGGPLASTSKVPVHLVPEGNHCSDLDTGNGAVNAGVAAIQKAEIDQIVEWVGQYPPQGYGGYGGN